ncbi:hypothetical protein E4T66_12610 [Sinimarinibacterium sp. CAU 1509]|uniref:hypothetical protein n=1 Tax=Sinimarinibacterium sp. CAU 1509 TaxID=2562283 RepID=UPI0010ABE0DB|nr:hypothetical protein [Sinimarinibacterium sp. CAU 1509]TJY60017.1 hypothetical protein E4T66_12610 [Sinimarinibacterium sp. CAU 1509]
MEAVYQPRRDGSVLLGCIVMLLLNLLLFWLPVVGTLTAGVVGGWIAGGVGKALTAAALPALLLGISIFALTTLFTGMPMIAMVAGMGVAMLAMMQIGTLLIGAMIGGLFA